MNPIKQFTKKILQFRNERDWKKFHNPKDMALSLVLEAAEVLEHFQWKGIEETQEYVKRNKEKIGAELADVLFWVLLMSHDLDIDIEKAFEQKLKQNEEKYPVEKSKGKHTKYDKL